MSLSTGRIYMSDEQELQVNISGKAIYKAVKNLLQNDEQKMRRIKCRT